MKPIWAISAYSIAVFILFAIGVHLPDYPQIEHPHSLWILYVLFNGGTIAAYYSMKHWFMYEMGNTLVKMIAFLCAISAMMLMYLALEINKDIYLAYMCMAMLAALIGGIKGHRIRTEKLRSSTPS